MKSKTICWKKFINLVSYYNFLFSCLIDAREALRGADFESKHSSVPQDRNIMLENYEWD